MNNPTIGFDPHAPIALHEIVLVDHPNIAATGQVEWYPVALFLKDDRRPRLKPGRGNFHPVALNAEGCNLMAFPWRVCDG
jgi:hypothetical protein